MDVLHEVSVLDPYRWLEDQKSPETRAWIDAEDRCTAAVLGAAPGRAQIAKRLTELMKVDAVSLPLLRGGSYFFSERRADQDLFVVYKRHGLDGKDEVLLDPHPMSPDHSVSAGLRDISRDGALAAYAVRTGGRDEVTVHFIDTRTLKDLPDVLPDASYFAVSIAPNKRDLYYARTTPQGPRLFHHLMGSDVKSDIEIFGKGDGPDKIITATLSEDGHYLLIQRVFGSGSTRSEIYFQDLQSGAPIQPVVNDTDALFDGDIQGGTLFIHTNWKAPHWRIFAVDLHHPSRDSWKEIVPESDSTLESSGLFGGKIFATYVRNAVSLVRIFGTDGKPEGEIPLPGLGSVAGIIGTWDENEVFFGFESFNIPESIYRFDVTTQKLQVWSAPKVPVDSNAYAVDQVWYPSKDGTRVPMFLFHKKGIPHDGARPVWLTGYGGFNVSLTPNFNEAAVAWADAGGIYAQPILRGGGEFGEAWHQAGMMEKKQNVFDDFNSAAEWLIANGYTNPKKLAIRGGSNGGLLVGAALTERPDLYQAVVCEYPLLDMLRYHKFKDGPYWIPEYGSADDAAQFKYLLAYSPYQNVKEGTKYPAALFITGDGDTRVDPLHARKRAARLQAATASDRPVLLLYDTKSGHSGGRPLNKQIEERVDMLSFIFMQLGVAAK